MKLIIRVRTKEIVDISEIANVVENGIDVGDLIYAEPGLIVIDVEQVPTGVRSHTHKYIDGQFVKNIDFIEQLREEGRQQILSTTVVNLENQLLLIEGVI